MSKAKLEKFIQRPLIFDGVIKSHPILISDSKGFNLSPHADLLKEFHYNLEIQCKAGANFPYYYHWLCRNLKWKVNGHSSIVLYVFLGTCDLTYKSGRAIQLRHSDDKKALQYFHNQIERYLLLVSQYSTVRIVFLEIPPYSIVTWNEIKGVKNPESYHKQDLDLTRRVRLVNLYIQSVNDYLNVKSPRFTLDLLKFRKVKGKNQRRTLNFSNYKDGVHPSPLLARCWMKRIIAIILTDCA